MIIRLRNDAGAWCDFDVDAALAPVYVMRNATLWARVPDWMQEDGPPLYRPTSVIDISDVKPAARPATDAGAGETVD